MSPDEHTLGAVTACWPPYVYERDSECVEVTPWRGLLSFFLCPL